MSMFVCDKRGVTPVIGVVLMVAITVLLASVIGVYMFDFVKGLEDGSPNIAFRFEFNSVGGDGLDGDGGDEMVIVHSGGNNVGGERLDVIGPEASGEQFTQSVVRGGDSAVVSGVSGGEVYRVVWVSDDGEVSRVLARVTVP